MLVVMFLKLFITFLLFQLISTGHWRYGGGIKDWPLVYCYRNEGRQSPINIDTSNLADCPTKSGTFLDKTKNHLYISAQRLNLKEYSQPVDLIAENNGHTVVFSLKDTVTISSGGLKGRYKLVQFHFHWGSKDTKGSEHTIDRKSFSMEVHFVHEAMDDPDPTHRYAVIGVLFKIGKPNMGLKKLISVFDKIHQPGDEHGHENDKPEIKDFHLNSLLPSKKHFYRYNGSFTTPNCDEVVIWSVMQRQITVSSKQLTKFRALVDEGSHPVEDNFRPVQKLNDRTIYDC